MIPAGTLAWASCAPGFHPPGQHPVLVLKSFPNGNCLVVFVTHSDDLYQATIPLLRREIPSAFREHGGPLSDPPGAETSVLGLIDSQGCRRIVDADMVSPTQLRIGTADVYLTYIKQLPEAEWGPLRERIRRELGLP